MHGPLSHLESLKVSFAHIRSKRSVGRHLLLTPITSRHVTAPTSKSADFRLKVLALTWEHFSRIQVMGSLIHFSRSSEFHPSTVPVLRPKSPAVHRRNREPQV